MARDELNVRLADNGLDQIARGMWNNGAPVRTAAREFARQARLAALQDQ